jgi:hypothetical protein
VPAFWVAGPPPLSAEPIFGCGMRDETFARAGITHLVEHLVMSAVERRRHHYHNASVSIGSTSFTATGPPEAVRDFMHDVCAALRELPTDRLEIERRILAAEAGGGRVGLLGWHLLLRYGLRGPGLAGADPPAVDQIGAAEARDWAARELVRSNAVLALSGPPPDGLRLDLPAGPRPDRPVVEPLPLRTAVWDRHPADRGVGLSLLVPDGPAAAMAASVLGRRLTEELRHRRGLAYDVALGGYAATAIATVPAGVDLRMAGFELRPDNGGRWLDGRAFPRRPFGPAPRGASLVVGDEGVSLRLRDRAVSVPWPELVGYGIHADGRRSLYGGFGTRIDLDPAHFVAGRRALALVDERVRAEVRFTEPVRKPAGAAG